MTKRGIENPGSVPQDTPPSPPPPMASPAPTSTPPPNQDSSPPIMLATMTPVSVIGLPQAKDFDDHTDGTKSTPLIFETQIIKTEVQQPQQQHLTDEFVTGGDDDDHSKHDVVYEEQGQPDTANAATETLQEVHLVDPGTGQTTTVVATPASAVSNAATVSVVVQQPGQILNQAYQQQHGTGTTVLVLSELVEDMSPVIGIRTASPASGGPLLTSQVKATNGLGSGAGHELIAPPPVSSAGLSGGGATSPVTVAPSAELQGLFLHHQQQQQQQQLLHHPHLHHQQQLIVKREPEDLSHHRHKTTGSPLQDGVGTSSIIISNKAAASRHKLVLVSSAANGGGATPGPGDLVVDVVNSGAASIKEEHHRGLNSPQHGSRSINGTPTSTSSSLLGDAGGGGPIELIATADGGLKQPMSYSTQIFAPQHHGTGGGGGSGTPSPIPYSDHVTQYTTTVVSGGGLGNAATGGGAGYVTGNIRAAGGSATHTFVADPYNYREYLAAAAGEQYVTATQVRQQIPTYADSPEGGGGGSSSGVVATAASLMDRFVRQSSVYHSSKGVVSAATAAGLTVDLPSPDSGIGAEAITPRDQTAIQQSFDYADLCPAGVLTDPSGLTARPGAGQSPGQGSTGGRSRPWHDFGRQNDADKIQIPKLFSQYGFKYHLETPISTSQRREDDRITYINKGQFYGITLEYIPDPDKPLKSQTVKSIVMLMFREEKSPEDEIKAWQFWHGRQHSVKQRILDADTKNSVGLVGCIEEVAHNAIAVYWNPLESSAKINVAVQCLSTDFSSQKGVKGLPLHLQIDTYEDPRDGPVFHRGYCQIKVFCDKGAERKTRDEERRAAKRKMTATGRKKLDELYHPAAERSEFYTMSDLNKPPVLFTPAEDIDKLTSMELQGFYSHETDSSSLSNGEASCGSQHGLGKQGSSPFLLHSSKPSTTPTLKFHNHFPPDTPGDKKDGVLDNTNLTTDGNVFTSPPLKRAKMMAAPSLNERVMLYVRQDTEEVYTPLHVVPPTTQGLLNADYSQN